MSRNRDHDVGREGGEFEGEEEPDQVIGGCGEHESGDGEHEERVELSAVGSDGEEGETLVDIFFELAVDCACEIHEQEQRDGGDDELRVGDQVREEGVGIGRGGGRDHACGEDGDGADPGREAADGADWPLTGDHDEAGPDEEDDFWEDEGEFLDHGVASVKVSSVLLISACSSWCSGRGCVSCENAAVTVWLIGSEIASSK